MEYDKSKEPKAKFQHIRRKSGELYATICTITNDEKIAYGIAICGDDENFKRKEGKRKSLGRARRAYYTDGKDYPLNNIERANVVYFLQNVIKTDIPHGQYKSYVVKLKLS